MTEYDICNTALDYIGQAETITDYVSNTTASALCGRLYPIAYSNLMEEYPWSFAVRVSDLTEVTDEASDLYGYVYQMPTDCLRVLRILPATDGYINEYEIQYTLDGETDTKRILCNISDAQAEYIYDVDNPLVFTASFADALAWRLALLLAFPLSADTETIHRVQQFEMRATAKAKLLNARQQQKAINQGNRYISARS